MTPEGSMHEWNPTPDTGMPPTPSEFNWRNHMPEAVAKLGGPDDYASWHGAFREDAEALMEKIAEASREIDFSSEQGDPLDAMIRHGEARGIVTAEEAKELAGLFGSMPSRLKH